MRRAESWRSTSWRFGARVFTATAVTTLTVFMATTGNADAVNSGNVCGEGGGSVTHGYSIGIYCGANNSGIVSSWSDNDFYLANSEYNYVNSGSPDGGFLTHEMWDVTTSGFVEEGLINADDSDHSPPWGSNDGSPNPCGTGCTAYQQFWGDGDQYGNYYFHWLSNLSPNSSTSYAYGIVPNGTGDDWSIGIDFATVGISTNQLSDYGTKALIGMEFFTPDAGELTSSDYSDTFAQTLTENISGTWTAEPFSGWNNTVACGSGSGYYPNGNCTNGISYSAGEWSSNIPG